MARVDILAHLGSGDPMPPAGEEGSSALPGGGGDGGDGGAHGDTGSVGRDVVDRADSGSARAADGGVAHGVQGNEEVVMEVGVFQGNNDGAGHPPVGSGYRGGRAQQHKSQQKQAKRRARQASQLASPL